LPTSDYLGSTPDEGVNMSLTTPILLVPLDAGKLHYLLAKHPGSAGLKALARELGHPA